jgi:hypothetical protein
MERQNPDIGSMAFSRGRSPDVARCPLRGSPVWSHGTTVCEGSQPRASVPPTAGSCVRVVPIVPGRTLLPSLSVGVVSGGRRMRCR